MHAAAFVGLREDMRDATYVRVSDYAFRVVLLLTLTKYETLIDRYARQPRRKPQYVMKTFYGRLIHIFVVTLPPSERLRTNEPAVHFLAAIETCEIERSRDDIDAHYYTKLGSLDMVDVTCIQCLVGRIRVEGGWAIIDRSGDLARAIYAAQDDEGL